MSNFEELFGSCTLQVIAPDTSVKYPEPGPAVDDWLLALNSSGVERRQAFFDEHLRLLLIVQINSPSDDLHPKDPPQSLLDFLSHVQVSLEATYISQTPTTLPETPNTAPELGEPRTSFVLPRPTSLRSSLFPPHTPNPIPSSAERDRKYAQSEGTLLLASIWGHKPENSPKEKFCLVYSESRKAWLAVYELHLTVSFLRLPFSDPLLSLTVSTTLRDKAVSLSQENHPFVMFLSESGILAKLSASGITSFSKQQNQETDDGGEYDLTELEEVNLLEGLSPGYDVALNSEPFCFPSTRLGNVTRRQIFSLPPMQPSPTQLLSSGSKHLPQATLRKSFRKILQTVSGFRVRMRTVFVPHILGLNSRTGSKVDDDDTQEREGGNNERTVVLCVEVENSGESGPDVGFSVEMVDVKINGECASTRLIGWGEGACEAEVKNNIFPLLIGSMEQYNLLYTVSFLKPTADTDFSLARQPGASAPSNLQRAVAIDIYGKPYVSRAGKEHDFEDNNGSTMTYPTHTFSSRWNCILDLSLKPPEEPLDFSDPSGIARSVLPEPTSPFPGQTALASVIPNSRVPSQPVAGNKPNTLPSNIAALRAVNPAANFRLPTSYRDSSSASPIHSIKQFTPPTVAMQAYSKSPSTTFGVPSPTAFLSGGGVSNGGQFESQTFVTPPTPGYPAYPPSTASTVSSFPAPLSSRGAYGPSIEIPRERGLGMNMAVPQTPGPTIAGSAFTRDAPVTGGEPIIVSVGLLAPPSSSAGSRRLYPRDQFTLDIFVFNQSSWTRRFEISCPDPDRWRRQKIEHEKVAQGSKTTMEELKSLMTPPGILSLQNRVRVGPLRPSTCQSVRMDFLAMSPGVHSVEVLSLADIETGFSVNLRSVLDIVVHERRQI